jgi:GNAT superfamily N-acetyltransferase
MPYVVRAARPTDLEFIVDGNAQIAEESEGRTLDRELLEAGVAAVLADPRKGRYFVADDGEGPVGQLMLTSEWSDWRCGEFWWIQSVYVLPRARGQGVFTLLYHYVRDLATRDPEVCGLRLYVERDNARALSAYRHVGLEDPGYQVLELELRSPDRKSDSD